MFSTPLTVTVRGDVRSEENRVENGPGMGRAAAFSKDSGRL